jgi:hypothetical protein
MAGADAPIVISDCRGGQNGADPPHAIGPTQVVFVRDVEWHRATLARKRRGSRLIERDTGSALPTNVKFSTLAGAVAPNATNGYGVVLQAADLSAWYGWGYGVPASDFSTVGAADTPASESCLVFFNGKWVAAYDSSVDRLHYLGVGGGNSYRVGLAAPSAPVITETAGAATDLRKYRGVLYYSGSGARSEPSAETAVKTLAAERATAGAPLLGGVPPELYDRWELQVATDDDNYATWWVVGNAAATVDIVDNNATIFGVLEPAPELGLFEPPHSAKYLVVDDNRLLMAGAYEAAATPDTAKLQQRVWFTPVLGDRDQGDDERIPDTASGQKNWVDIDGGDGGGDIMGFGPPTLGDVLVFKRRQIWRLIRTGNLLSPYIPRAVSKSAGSFGYRTICAGEDANGHPCVYFAGSRGPYRVGSQGVEYLGRSLEDLWPRVNQYGNAHTSQHAVFYQDRGQYWLWVSLDGETVPTTLLVLTVATGGWSLYTGLLNRALCSAILPRFINEANKGITTSTVFTAPFVPYCCPNTNGSILECDGINPGTGAALDTDGETYSGSGTVWTNGTTYRAYLQTGPLDTRTLDGRAAVVEGSVFAEAASGVSIAVGAIPNYDLTKIVSATVVLTASGSETQVLKRLDGLKFGDAKAVQLQIGDSTETASQWVIHAVQARLKGGADR